MQLPFLGFIGEDITNFYSKMKGEKKNNLENFTGLWLNNRDHLDCNPILNLNLNNLCSPPVDLIGCVLIYIVLKLVLYNPTNRVRLYQIVKIIWKMFSIVLTIVL